MGLRRLAVAAVAVSTLLGAAACGGSGSSGKTDAAGQSGSASPKRASSVEGGTAITVGMGTAVYTAPMQTSAFSDAGFTVTQKPVTSGATAVPLLLNGQLQFSEADVVGVLTAISKGVPLEIVGAVTSAGTSAENDNTGIIVKTGDAITGAKDLSGKKVGVNAIGGTAQIAAEAAIDAAGGDASKVQWVELPPAELVQGVTRGTVAAAVVTRTGAEASEGVTSILEPVSATMPAAPLIVWVTSKQYAAQHADVVQRFAKATQSADEMLAADPDQVRRVTVDTSPTKISAAAAQQLILAQFSPSTVQAAGLQTVIDLMAKYHVIDKPIQASSALASS